MTAPAGDAQIVVGIDAGGSATRARAVAAGRVIHEGRGGPGNPLATGPDALAASYLAALAGCPEPARVAACVSGAGGLPQRTQVELLLAGRFPSASIQVVPDYVAAVLAAPAGTDVIVIAGTGSVVCSAAPDGGYAVSGGRGWILGDRGSAARLGQAALEWFCEEPGRDPELARMVRECVGLADWRDIVGALAASVHPSALLARAAPVLTRSAEQGSAWAAARLEAEMAALARATARHIERHLSPSGHAGRVRVALAGGVWASPAARSAFAAALAEQPASSAALLAGPVDPLDGATRLASAADLDVRAPRRDPPGTGQPATGDRRARHRCHSSRQVPTEPAGTVPVAGGRPRAPPGHPGRVPLPRRARHG